MAEVIGERIKQRMQELGLSQSALARAVGIKQPSIGRLISGETRRTNHLLEIAQALRTTPEFITGDSETSDLLGDHRPTFRGFPPEDEPHAGDFPAAEGMVPVRELDLAFGMGATFLDVPVTERVRYFPREWLRQFTKAPPEQLAWVQGVGDSMAPTLLDSDTLLLDLSRKSLSMSDQVWALAYCGLGMVKRLRPTPDGGLRLLSDNPAVPEETSHDGEVQLIGRVVAFTRKL